jgi:hypothetical protein
MTMVARRSILGSDQGPLVVASTLVVSGLPVTSTVRLDGRY